ncbi:MAG: signal peptide peptidase SppA [Alphaproteobacteria bacterium]|nr:signal peptide peptidase SppA [Alphaproteobacteria bacterium]
MTFLADDAVDRRRLKRRLSAWRAVAIVAVAAAVIVGVGEATGGFTGRHVARVTIKGTITEDRERDEKIKKLAENRRVRAVIVHIDSPGGTVVGGERLYRTLRKLAEKRPVVAVMGTTATSAGYMVALGADRLVAGSGSVTGSIGVVMQTTEVTRLLETIGVSAEAIKSGALKAVPSPFEKLTPEGRKATQSVVDDVHAMFVDMVAERREMDRDQAKEIADGRVYTGRQAVEKGLVDEVGGEEEARAWLKKRHGIDDKLPVEDVDIDEPSSAMGIFTRAVAHWALAGKTLVSERLTLDGLISVWHPQ